MIVAYADPPYLGLCSYYDHDHGADGRCWNDVETHAALVARLCDDYPDGWALSCHAPALRAILPLCPGDVRVGAWVKPFVSFKPGINPVYAWEPLLWRGGRRTAKEARSERFVRDWVAAASAIQKGLVGAKPEEFAFWLFRLLNLSPDDTFVDLFPGSGGITVAWKRWRELERFNQGALDLAWRTS